MPDCFLSTSTSRRELPEGLRSGAALRTTDIRLLHSADPWHRRENRTSEVVTAAGCRTSHDRTPLAHDHVEGSSGIARDRSPPAVTRTRDLKILRGHFTNRFSDTIVGKPSLQSELFAHITEHFTDDRVVARRGTINPLWAIACGSTSPAILPIFTLWQPEQEERSIPHE